MNRCRLYVPNTKRTREELDEEPPTVVTEDGDVLDEIEKIMGHRKLRGSVQYLVSQVVRLRFEPEYMGTSMASHE